MQPAPEHQEAMPVPSPAAFQGHRVSGGKPKELTPKRSDGSCAEMGAAVCGSEMVFWKCKLKYI